MASHLPSHMTLTTTTAGRRRQLQHQDKTLMLRSERSMMPIISSRATHHRPVGVTMPGRTQIIHHQLAALLAIHHQLRGIHHQAPSIRHLAAVGIHRRAPGTRLHLATHHRIPMVVRHPRHIQAVLPVVAIPRQRITRPTTPNMAECRRLDTGRRLVILRHQAMGCLLRILATDMGHRLLVTTHLRDIQGVVHLPEEIETG
mmetsp:Transcript_33104/g.61730  ORF Transcript_33104/g.61730 Transcript_33104/m.61730 type:complete len:201 (+) Transcript_33104:222-824(+)